jgi:hypothetical protein
MGSEPKRMKLHRRWLRRLFSPSLLNRMNALSHLEDRLFDLEARRTQLARIVLRGGYANLFSADAGQEFQVFSQNGEDGLLLWLLRETGAPVKTFVEIGIENGRECNTAVLAFVLGWDGLMVEADPLGVAAAQRLARRMLRGRPNCVEIRQALVTRENINALIGGPDLGVLSIDVDGMDYWLWKAVQDAIPDIVVVEYNASMGPNESITVPYRAGFSAAEAHPSGYYHGASLAALEKLGREKRYALVAVDAAGVNAFFVRDVVRPETLRARSAAELFRPHLVRTRRRSLEQQWALIRHLPYERV